MAAASLTGTLESTGLGRSTTFVRETVYEKMQLISSNQEGIKLVDLGRVIVIGKMHLIFRSHCCAMWPESARRLQLVSISFSVLSKLTV